MSVRDQPQRPGRPLSRTAALPDRKERRRRIRRFAAALALSLAVCACTSTRRPAPVVERTPPGAKPAPQAAAPAPAVAASQPDLRPEFYTVKKGDTLYTIALDHGLDHKELALLNNLGDANVIRMGQQLRLRAPGEGAVAMPFRSAPSVEGKSVAGAAAPAATAPAVVKSQPKAVKVPYSDQALAQLSGQAQAKPVPPAPAKADVRTDEKQAADDGDEARVDWSWPAGGKLASSFNETTNLKGIGIAGRLGEAVHASAPGTVLYSGDGIRGYGKLVIIKHNKAFLSVYAHNSRLLVKEGQSVARGQKIAEMGNTDADQVKLHFEIRRFGKPVDPIKLLPSERPA
jgi:lipoprotein NlpD